MKQKGSGINKGRLKIVWLCHFSNQEMKEYFNVTTEPEFAPWINLLIQLFKERKDIEIHIIAPNVFNNKDCNFEKNGIHYYFYKINPLPINNRYLNRIYTILKIDINTNYIWIKNKIGKNIHKINPDLIHLNGAENPYYSAGILPLIDKYPTLVTIQGFIRNEETNINSNIKNRVKIEETIIKKASHFGVRTDEMNKIILQINPEATLHFHSYPYQIPKIIKSNIGDNEPIDCLFFGRVCRDKGIEDLLLAISIAKKENPSISLVVIGGISTKYVSFLKKICSELGIEKNVQFLGFLPTQEDIYKYAVQAKMCVLPTFHDTIPGTIIESMFMKLPVVAYAVGGIPEINRTEENIVLVEKRNVKQLSEKIIQLLNNVELRKTLAEKSFVDAYQRFDKDVCNDIMSAYNKILNLKHQD